MIAEKDKAKPLFLYVPFNAVHGPLMVPEEYLKPYVTLEGPRRVLAGMLAAADEAVGQIVAALEKSDLRENTLIVFSADNGGPRPGDNSPLRDFKGTIYEGGVRGCAFANWPGHIPSGVRIGQPMHVVDWYPTLVKLAGGSLEQPLPLDGKDVWPMLTEGVPSPHDAILCVQSPERAAVRMGDWKLIVNGGKPAPKAKAKARARAKAATSPTPKDGIELYNLAEDIGEEENLAEKESERVAAMRRKLAELLKDAVPPGAPQGAANGQ